MSNTVASMAREREINRTPEQVVKEQILKTFDPQKSILLARELALQYAQAEIQSATDPAVRESWEIAERNAKLGEWGDLRVYIRSDGTHHEDEQYGASLIMLVNLLKNP